MTKRPQKPIRAQSSTTHQTGSTTSPKDDDPKEGQIIPLPFDAEQKLKAIGADPRDPKFRTAVLIGTAYAGPIPPPDMLVEYGRVFPGLPEKIISWNEDQRTHRMQLEILVTTGSEKRMDRGQTFAFGLAFAGILAASIVGVMGSPVVASVIAIVAIGGPAAAFILARSFDWAARSSVKTSPPIPRALPKRK